MEEIEELLSEEVRQFEHLYNPSLKDYKDTQMARNSWRQISANVGLPVEDCSNMWKKLRDRFVRAKKIMLNVESECGKRPLT